MTRLASDRTATNSETLNAPVASNPLVISSDACPFVSKPPNRTTSRSHCSYVTPLVNGIRRLTTSIPAARFARIANLMAPLFQGFCFVVDALGIRAYTSLSRREAALALMDIFGAPYAHAHSYDEVAAWFRAEGATELWPCNEGRRGFGICGRLNHVVPSQAV